MQLTVILFLTDLLAIHALIFVRARLFNQINICKSSNLFNYLDSIMSVLFQIILSKPLESAWSKYFYRSHYKPILPIDEKREQWISGTVVRNTLGSPDSSVVTRNGRPNQMSGVTCSVGLGLKAAGVQIHNKVIIIKSVILINGTRTKHTLYIQVRYVQLSI